MKRILLLLPILSLCTFSFAQYAPSDSSIAALRRSLLEEMESARHAGLMVGITSIDSVWMSEGMGWADIENQRAINANTLFRMGSITKMFVSLGILQLAEEGHFTIESPLREIAPEVAVENDWEDKTPLRIVHLLEHTSGFDDCKLNRMYSLDEQKREPEALLQFQQVSMRCRWQPGERMSYSNVNYTVLGYLIYKFTGKPYDVYLQEQLLQALGMNHSHFHSVSGTSKDDVKEYAHMDGKLQAIPQVNGLNPPAGALWSNSSDMLRFVQCMLRNGEPIVSPGIMASFEQCSSGLAAEGGPQASYAKGNYNVTLFAKYPFTGHDGLTGSCYSSLGYNRELGVGFVVSGNSNRSMRRMAGIITDWLTEQHPGPGLWPEPLDTAAIQPWLGQYAFDSPRNEIAALRDRLLNTPRLYMEEGKLMYQSFMGSPYNLVPTGPLEFRWAGANTATIILTQDDKGEYVLCNSGGYYVQRTASSIWFKRIAALLGVLLILSAVLLGVGALGWTIIGKIPWQTGLFRIIPIVALVAFALALSQLLEVERYTYLLAELGEVNSRTLSIFLGSLLFGVLSGVGLAGAILQFRQKSSMLAVYYLLVGLAMCGWTVFLGWNGWIGLRTWAM